MKGPFHVEGISSVPNEGYAADLSSYGLGPFTNEVEYQDASAVLGKDMADLSTHTLTPTSDDEPPIVDPRHPGIVRNQGSVSHDRKTFLEYDGAELIPISLIFDLVAPGLHIVSNRNAPGHLLPSCGSDRGHNRSPARCRHG